MTELDIIEVMAHPSFDRLLRKRIADVLREEVVPNWSAKHKAAQRVKVAPEGFLLYKDAATAMKVKEQSIRHAVHKKQLVGANGIVSKASIQLYLEQRANRVTRARFETP